jgi:predicted nucleic acid-binding protein
MIYADLPAGATVFLDASVFIHHFEPNAAFGPAATEFLEGIENQAISGVTATHIVSEVAHRLMTIEAMQAFGWKSADIALRLRNHPAQVQTLKRFRQAVQEIPLFGIRILTIDPAWLDPATAVSQQTACCTTTRLPSP